jgi:CHAT domain
MDDLDFDIRIGKFFPQEGAWHVSVRSPAGEAEAFMHFTVRMHQIMTQRSGSFDGVIASLRDQETHRTHLSPDERFTQEVGLHLFNALMVEDIRHHYYESKLLADAQGRRLRLVLHTAGAPALMALPWELLYDPREREHLCLSRHISLIRYMDLEKAIPPLEIHGPLRILVAGANPQGVSKLDIAREWVLIRKALQPLETQGVVKLRWLGENTTLRQLENALDAEGPWHIVHFICHGGVDAVRSEGFITLVDESHGGKRQVLATQLGRLFTGRSPRLVVLNSCEGGQGGATDPFSSIASILTNYGIPAIVAMQYGITDKVAVEFADRFYHELAKGAPVDVAVTEARLALSIDHPTVPEWGTPVLYMRARNSVLFKQSSPTESPPQNPKQPQSLVHPEQGSSQSLVPSKQSRPLWHWLVVAVVGVLLLSGLGAELLINGPSGKQQIL